MGRYSILISYVLCFKLIAHFKTDAHFVISRYFFLALTRSLKALVLKACAHFFLAASTKLRAATMECGRLTLEVLVVVRWN